MINIQLPYPPSVNHYWFASGSRRFIGKKGIEFRKSVAEIVAENAEKMTGRLALFVALYPPDRRRRDIDNTQKALADALQHAGCYDDDEQIDILHVVRREIIKGGKCQVIIVQSDSFPKLSMIP